jgi:ABC-type uncharacterized transport system permease subunit
VELARVFLGVLGVIFAVAGLVVSWTFDSIAGIAVLLIGAFLLILPLMSYRSDD